MIVSSAGTYSPTTKQRFDSFVAPPLMGDDALPQPRGEIFKIDLSDEAKAGLIPSDINPQSTPPPPPTLPDIVVSAINARASDYETLLRSQLPQGVPDYGSISRQVNDYYISQYSNAGNAVFYVNTHLTVDESLLDDPVTAEIVKNTREQLTKLIYESIVNPTGIVNGPGMNDITGAELRNRLDNQNFEIRAGFGIPLAFHQANADGSGTLVFYPQQYAGFYAGSNTSSASQAATILYHEIGHALNQQEYMAAFGGFANPLRNQGVSEADIFSAWGASALKATTEARATAMGHGAAELAGLAGLYKSTFLAYGEALR